MATEPLLTACLIVRNEERNIARCLRSLEGLVDSAIVVDTGSEDSTREIACEHGALVLERPWVDCFATARNHALEAATGRWLLVCDADEELVGTDKDETRAHLEADEGLPDVLLVRMSVVYANGQEVEYLAPRMVRASAGIRFKFRVHEQLNVDCGALLSNVTLHHHGYAAADALERKEERNLRLAQLMGLESAHGLHSVARAAFSLQRWGLVVEAAQAIAKIEAPPLLISESCVLAAAAAFNLKDAPAMERFVEKSLELAPGSSDTRLVALVAAAAQYVHSIEAPGPDQRSVGLRPQVFWHNKRAALQLLRSLVHGTTSRTPVVVGEED